MTAQQNSLDQEGPPLSSSLPIFPSPCSLLQISGEVSLIIYAGLLGSTMGTWVSMVGKAVIDGPKGKPLMYDMFYVLLSDP